MQLDSKKLRFCMSIACDELSGTECKAKECKELDKVEALAQLRKKQKEVKHGGNS